MGLVSTAVVDIMLLGYVLVLDMFSCFPAFLDIFSYVDSDEGGTLKVHFEGNAIMHFEGNTILLRAMPSILSEIPLNHQVKCVQVCCWPEILHLECLCHLHYVFCQR